jgi:hypothetical protein
MPSIAELNDELRKTFSGGHIMVTAGVRILHPDLRLEVMEAVRNFDAFTPENDPLGEHDCAVITVQNQKFIWKVDYYDQSLSEFSPDPTDTAVTIRILTIMLAAEY